MDERVKAKWVAALRSGDFAQGRDWLAQEDPEDNNKLLMCCLGVLCELHREEVGAPWGWQKNIDIRGYAYTDCGKNLSETTLPLPVARWAGVDSENPRAGGAPLSCFNDGRSDFFPEIDRPYSFSEIADLIEKYL